jgi:hypothetical protein
MTTNPCSRRTVLKVGAAAAFAGTVGAAASRAQTPALQHYTMMVMSNPAPGREAEYNHWYDTVHLPDVVSIPGFVRARRLKLAPVQFHQSPPMPNYMAFFQIETADVAGVFAEINRRIKTGRTRMSTAMNMAGAHERLYQMLAPPVMATETPSLDADADAADGFHIVFNTQVPGKEAAFNAWYNNHHLPDMLTIPGFVSGQRGKAPGFLPDPAKTEPPYVAIFRFLPVNLAALSQNFTALVPHMEMEPVMAGADGYTYMPFGPVLSGDVIRAEREAKSA